MDLMDSKKIILSFDNTQIASTLFDLFLNSFKFFTNKDNMADALSFFNKTLKIGVKFHIDLIVLDNLDYVKTFRELSKKVPIVILSYDEVPPSILKKGNIFCFKYTTNKQDWSNIFTYVWEKEKRRAVTPYLQQLQILNLH